MHAEDVIWIMISIVCFIEIPALERLKVVIYGVPKEGWIQVEVVCEPTVDNILKDAEKSSNTAPTFLRPMS